MRCESARTALSARLDVEEPGVDPEALDQHLMGCAACRSHAEALGALHRAFRVREADEIPDLTGAVLAGVPLRRARPERGDWIRYALLAAGLTLLVLALPALFTPSAAGDAHLAREHGAWSAALALAVMFVAWQPARARGLVPLAAALGAITLITAVVDVVGGVTPPAAESVHAVELGALGLLWLQARQRTMIVT